MITTIRRSRFARPSAGRSNLPQLLVLLLPLSVAGCGKGLLGRTVFNSGSESEATGTQAEEAAKDGDAFSEDSSDLSGPGGGPPSGGDSSSSGSGSGEAEADPTPTALRLEAVRTLKSTLCTRITVSVVDAAGTERIPSASVTVNLGKTLGDSSSTLTYFNSTRCASGTEITSVSLAGVSSLPFYALPVGSGSATITASADGLISAELGGTLATPSWSEPENLGSVSGFSNLSGNSYHHSLFPRLVDDGTGGAAAFFLQGFNLMVNTVDSSGTWSTASEVDALPGKVRDFDAAGDVNRGSGVLVAWAQTVPSEGVTAVYARVRTASGAWGSVVRLSTEGKFSRSPRAAFSTETAVGGWVVWEEGSSATDEIGGLVFGARLSPQDGSILEGPTELSADGNHPRVALGTGVSGAVLTFTRGTSLYSRSGASLSGLTDATIGGPGALIDTLTSNLDATSIELSASGPSGGGLRAVASWFDSSSKVKAAIYASGAWSAASTLDTGVSQTFARNGIDSSGNAFVAWRKYTTEMKPSVARYAAGTWSAVQSWSGAGYLHSANISVTPAGSACLYMGSNTAIASTVCFDSATSTWESGLSTVPASSLETFPVSGVLLASGASHMLGVLKMSAWGAYRVASFSRPTLSGTTASVGSGAQTGITFGSVSHAIDLGTGGELQSFWDAPADAPAFSRSQYRSYTAAGGFGSATALDEGPQGGVVATRLARDASGNTTALYVVRTAEEGYDSYKVWTRRRTSGSSAWSDPVDLTGAATLTSPPSPSLRMNKSGDALAVWSNGYGNLFGTAFDGNAGSWGTTQIIETSQSSSEFEPELSIDSSGNGWLAYQYEGASREIQVRSFTKGSGWSAGATLASGSMVAASGLKPVSLAGDSSGRVVVCYIQSDDLSCRSHADGTWAVAETINTGRTGHVVVADAEGRFHVAYADQSTNQVTVRTLAFGESAKWIDAVSISASLSSSASLQLMGGSDALGNTVLAWGLPSTLIQALDSSTPTDIQAARYTSSGWTSASSLKVGTGIGALGSVAVSMTGEAVVSWYETGATGGLSLKASLLE